MIASAIARIDALSEEVAELKARNRQIRELTTELLGIISGLESERDTWRAKAGQ